MKSIFWLFTSALLASAGQVLCYIEYPLFYTVCFWLAVVLSLLTINLIFIEFRHAQRTLQGLLIITLLTGFVGFFGSRLKPIAIQLFIERNEECFAELQAIVLGKQGQITLFRSSTLDPIYQLNSTEKIIVTSLVQRLNSNCVMVYPHSIVYSFEGGLGQIIHLKYDEASPSLVKDEIEIKPHWRVIGI